MLDNYLKVDWPSIKNVTAWQTTRQGGVSRNGFAEMNLSIGVFDDQGHVEQNRLLLDRQLTLPAEPQWIKLVHGNRVVDVAEQQGLQEADAIYTNIKNKVLIIPTADCLPVLFSSTDGGEIAAAHAGWRSLSTGILENTLNMFSCDTEQINCWLGPAIGKDRFEVGEDVISAFRERYPGCEVYFRRITTCSKYMADLYGLARFALNRAGITHIYGGGFCTYDDNRFFSYRRQGKGSGRMASLIWRS